MLWILPLIYLCLFILVGSWIFLAHLTTKYRWAYWLFNASLIIYILGFALISLINDWYVLITYSQFPNLYTRLCLTAVVQFIVFCTSLLAIIPQTRRYCFKRLPFNPESAIHLVGLLELLQWAGFFIICLIFFQMPFHQQSLSSLTLISAIVPVFFLHIALTLLGCGLFYRRNLQTVIKRLNIEKPRWRDLGVAVGATLFFLLFTFGAKNFLAIYAPDLHQDYLQLSHLYSLEAKGLELIVMAAIIALCAGIGEELFYRGLLQPVYGPVPSWLLFTLNHYHYGLTSLFILVALLGLFFSWARQRYNTTTCIIVHILYDFCALAVPWSF